MEIYIVTEAAKYSNGEDIVFVSYEMKDAMEFARKRASTQAHDGGIYVRCWIEDKCIATLHESDINYE